MLIRRYIELGLGVAIKEIRLATGLRLKHEPRWLIKPSRFKGQYGTIVITVGMLEEVLQLLKESLQFGGYRHRVELFWEAEPDSVCPRCCGIGHRGFRTCRDRLEQCLICAGAHKAVVHYCNVQACRVRAGEPCQHMPARCANCGGKHEAVSPKCPKVREARRIAVKRS